MLSIYYYLYRTMFAKSFIFNLICDKQTTQIQPTFMKTFKIMMAIAVAIFATTSLIVSLTSPIKSLLDVNVKALTQDEGGTGGIGGGEGSVIAYYGPNGTYEVKCPKYHMDPSGHIVTEFDKRKGTYCERTDTTPCTPYYPCS